LPLEYAVLNLLVMSYNRIIIQIMKNIMLLSRLHWFCFFLGISGVLLGAGDVPMWKFVDESALNIPIYVKYRLSNRSYAVEKEKQYSPEAMVEYAHGANGETVMRLQRDLPKDSPRAKNVSYVFWKDKAACLQDGSSVVVLGEASIMKRDPTFSDFLTRYPITENVQQWIRFSDLFAHPDFAKLEKKVRKQGDETVIEIWGPKEKKDGFDYQGILLLKLKEMDGVMYPLYIAYRDAYTDANNKTSISPDTISVVYGDYQKLEKAQIYIPWNIVAESVSVSLERAPNGQLGFKREQQHVESIRVYEISEAASVIDSKLNVSIPDGVRGKNRTTGERVEIKGSLADTLKAM